MTDNPSGEMNPYVKSVRPLDDYELEVLFENGESRRFDVKPYLSRGIFVRLRDRSLFDAVRMVAGSVEWPGGLDLSYDTLYVGGLSIAEPVPEAAAAALNELAKGNTDTPETALPGAELGRLETEDPRLIWPREDKDFTPWLAANIDQLSEVIGIRLRVQQVEQKVGNYQLDIYARDENESVVIIENQLELTDHTHLGQLMAYAAGLDAKVIIWIATKVRDEHRLVIDWLNRNMGDDVSFFLVRLKVVHIENSKRAAQFVVEAEPSQFERTLDTIVARAPAIRPTRMVWSDQSDDPIQVTNWRAVLRRTLDRAIQEEVRLESLPFSKTTSNAAEGEEYPASFYSETQQTYVDINGNADWTKGKVNAVLRSMGKPDGFLRIECDDGNVVSLPT